MKFCASNSPDIRKYFENTFVKFAELGDKILFINRVRESVLANDAEGNIYEVLLDDDLPYEMNYKLPHRGLFVYNNDVHILTRIPARQYKRGLCGDNTSIRNVMSGKAIRVDFNTLTAFTDKPAYLSLQEALFGKHVGKNPSVLLSSRIWYSPTKQTFYIGNVPVAQFNRENKKIFFPFACGKLFEPELRALYNDPLSSNKASFA